MHIMLGDGLRTFNLLPQRAQDIRMGAIFVAPLLFCIAVGQAFSLCLLTEYTMYVEKKECAYCLAINTTICSGFCMTKDPNLKEGLPKMLMSQKVCSYKQYIHRTVTIPGCPMHVNPLFSYPVAISCECDKCNTGYTDCVQDTIKTNYCTKPFEPQYLGFSNYI
uniref:Thyrotropin subunit beta n=1 Tax=Xenopus tropicalis TaxID=8364 RepID=A0A803JIF6_XENTR